MLNDSVHAREISMLGALEILPRFHPENNILLSFHAPDIVVDLRPSTIDRDRRLWHIVIGFEESALRTSAE